MTIIGNIPYFQTNPYTHVVIVTPYHQPALCMVHGAFVLLRPLEGRVQKTMNQWTANIIYIYIYWLITVINPRWFEQIALVLVCSWSVDLFNLLHGFLVALFLLSHKLLYDLKDKTKLCRLRNRGASFVQWNPYGWSHVLDGGMCVLLCLKMS